jgi:hypothetical protein
MHDIHTDALPTKSSRCDERSLPFVSPILKSSDDFQRNDRLGQTDFDVRKSTFESSLTSTPVHASIDTMQRHTTMISSIDSNLQAASPPIYQSTPKFVKSTCTNDSVHDTTDTINRTHEQDYIERLLPSIRVQDYSLSTPDKFDTHHHVQQTKYKFNHVDRPSTTINDAGM